MEEYLSRNYGHGIERGRPIQYWQVEDVLINVLFVQILVCGQQDGILELLDDVITDKDGIKRYNAQNFDFYDLTAVVKKDWIVEFCKRLIDENLKYNLATTEWN